MAAKNVEVPEMMVNKSRKYYGSARTYAEEVRHWMECTRFWLAGQQMLNQAANFNAWMIHQNQQAFAMAMAPQQGQSQANAQFQRQPQVFSPSLVFLGFLIHVGLVDLDLKFSLKI